MQETFLFVQLFQSDSIESRKFPRRFVQKTMELNGSANSIFGGNFSDRFASQRLIYFQSFVICLDSSKINRKTESNCNWSSGRNIVTGCVNGHLPPSGRATSLFDYCFRLPIWMSPGFPIWAREIRREDMRHKKAICTLRRNATMNHHPTLPSQYDAQIYWMNYLEKNIYNRLNNRL